MEESFKLVRTFDDKQVYLLSASSVEDIPRHLDALGPHFGILLALDARGVSDAALSEMADSVLAKGAVWVSAWGLDCERVERAFDYSCVELFPDATEESVVLTTAHAMENLAEVVEFFLNAARPASDYEKDTRAWIAVGMGDKSRELEDAIRATKSMEDLG